MRGVSPPKGLADRVVRSGDSTVYFCPIGDNLPDLIADSVLVGWVAKNEGQVREGQVREGQVREGQVRVAARSANMIEAAPKLDEQE